MTMKKKAYMKPEMWTLGMETAELMAYSGGSQSLGITIDGENSDYSEDDNRSRGLWDDQEW